MWDEHRSLESAVVEKLREIQPYIDCFMEQTDVHSRSKILTSWLRFMKRKGTGSRTSPIAIDDSDEEVVLEVFNANVIKPSQSENDQERQGNMAHDETIFNGNSRQKNRDFQGETIVIPSLAMLTLVNKGQGGQKRKRAAHVDQHDDYPTGLSRSKLPPPSLETRFSNQLSKNARKRRRKLERQAIEAETRSKQQFWLNGMNQLLPPFSWTSGALPYNVLDPLSSALPFANSNLPYPTLPQDPRPKVSYMTPPYNDHQPFDTNLNDSPIASTSAWVSSMAMAAENPAPIAVDSWAPPSHPPQSSHSRWPAIPELTPITSLSVSAHPLPPKPAAERPSLSREPREHHKPPPPSIGMQPDQDPSSKHGIFEPPATVSGVGASPYIPNPARTLVIEQLPKSHRNADWINSWCKSACGAHPVHLSVNMQGAKALVEFATAELARKAWGSPRLGSNYAGLKSHQLKGKPREDLIKVWWYRVDGIGAGAGVGEIEEGEIEGDAAEKEVEVPLKKETKKERKARLARGRMEKQNKQLEVAKELHPHPPLAPTNRALASLPQRPAPISTSTLSLSRPGLSTPVLHPHVDQQINLSSSASQSFPRATLYGHQNPPSRPPLQSQTELRAQWKEQRESKTFDKTSYGASARQQADSVDGAESESIASSRSPSPVEPSTTVQEVPLPSASMPSFDEQPDIMDVDDVSIDMDLSSPVTSRNPQPLPKYCSVPPHPSLPLNAPAPRLALHVSIPSPEPDSGAPVSNSNGIFRASSAQKFPRPLSSTSTHSSTPRGTPPLEPRAMKNAPKAPSYQKRSLLARKKELEERIARSRMELGLESPVVADSPPITVAPSDHLVGNHDGAEKHAMEERLRSLVLQSQRSKLKAGAPSPTLLTTVSSTSPSSLSTSSGAASLSSSSSSTGAATPAPTASVAATSFSFDDLAISFIEETIQTCHSSPQISSAVPVPISKSKPLSHVNSITKLELAAKQKRLEQEIAETKILMAKLTRARTKQEKDGILVEMREKSWCVSSLLLAACSLAIMSRLSIAIFRCGFFLPGLREQILQT